MLVYTFLCLVLLANNAGLLKLGEKQSFLLQVSIEDLG